MDIFVGMRMVLTFNYHKDIGAVNGTVVLVEGMTRNGIQIRLPTGVPYVIWRRPMNADGHQVYHISSAYALTVHKAQGLTLKCVALWLWGKRLPLGLVYTALSRVPELSSMFVFQDISSTGCKVQELPDWL